MYEDMFANFGLTDNQSVIYEYLLKNGENTAGNIIKNTSLKRGLVYNILEELCELKLINKRYNKNKVAIFSPEHPEKLREYLDNKEKDVIKAKNTLEANISSIISDFNLVSNKPGVRVFEGKDAFEKVMNDTLTSKTDILAYLDANNIDSFVEKIDAKKFEERIKLKINKKILIANNKNGRSVVSAKNKYTESKFLKNVDGFNSTVQIYDGKVAFITLAKDIKIGIIIQDKFIYDMQKKLFETFWSIY